MDLRSIAEQIAGQYTPPATGNHSRIGEADTVHQLLEYIEAGNYGETAAELTGIADNTFRNWIQRGEAGEEPYTLFLRAVKRAAAKAEHTEIGKVRKAGDDPRFWAASMTYLERKYPDKWGRRSEPNDASKVVINIGTLRDVQVIEVTSTPSLPTALPALDK